MFWKFAAFAALSALLFAGCGSQQTKPVEVISGTREAAEFGLTSLKGTRDGDRVAVQAVYGGGSQTLTVHLQFKLLPEAKLERGTWAGLAGEGRAGTFSHILRRPVRASEHRWAIRPDRRRRPAVVPR